MHGIFGTNLCINQALKIFYFCFPEESVRFDASIQTPPASESPVDSDSKPSPDLFLIGYNECFEEAVQFIVERESLDPTRLVVHLRNHYEEVSVSKG